MDNSTCSEQPTDTNNKTTDPRYHPNSYWMKWMIQQAQETKLMRRYLQHKFNEDHPPHQLTRAQLRRCQNLEKELYDDSKLNEAPN